MKLDEMETHMFKEFHDGIIYLAGDGLFIENWSEFKKKDVKDRIKEIKEMVDLLNEEKRWLKDILNR
jgi:NAD dependent epimerase/dehydratase family enzyme